jgi:hypothetical protein
MPITPDSPCHERWSALSPHGDGRYCQKCDKTVVDLTQLTRRQAEKIVVKAGGSMCGRMRLDPSGAPAFRRETERVPGFLSVAAASLLAACGSNTEDGASSSTTNTAASVESSAGGDHLLGEGMPTGGSIVMLPLADDRDLEVADAADTSNTSTIAAFSVAGEDTAVTPTDEQLLLTEAKDEARRPTTTAATSRRPRPHVDRPATGHPAAPPVVGTGRRNNGGSVAVAPRTAPLPAVNNPPDTMVYMGGISYTP